MLSLLSFFFVADQMPDWVWNSRSRPKIYFQLRIILPKSRYTFIHLTITGRMSSNSLQFGTRDRAALADTLRMFAAARASAEEAQKMPTSVEQTMRRLAGRERQVSAREEAVIEWETEVANRQEALNALETARVNRERATSSREAWVVLQESSFEGRERVYRNRDVSQNNRETELNDRQMELDDREDELNDRDTELMAHEEEFEREREAFVNEIAVPAQECQKFPTCG